MNIKTIKKLILSNKKALIISFFVILSGSGGLLCVFLWLTSPMSNPYTDVLSDKNYYIAHAAGALDGYRYMNCREALLKTLDNGYQFIEFDLGLTNDSVLVCLYDWKLFHKMTSEDSLNEKPITIKEFRHRKIYRKYTPLTIEDVLSIRKVHQFIIVTDKISNTEILNKFFTRDKKSIMVESFSLSDYISLKNAGFTPMMSLHIFNYPKIIKYFIFSPLIKHQKIDWICINTKSNMKSLRMLKRLFNCKVAMYTSNSPSFFKEHLGKEIDLVYTDATTQEAKNMLLENE